jgi:hypothetical protein
MTSKKLDFILFVVVTGIFLLLLLLPYGNSYNADNDSFEPAYLLDDVIMIISYIPFFLLLSAYLMLKVGLLKSIIKFVLIGLSFIYFLNSLGSLFIPLPDFTPGWGALISMTLFPIFIIYLISLRFVKRRS